MKAQIRQKEILKCIQESTTISVAALRDRFGVSDMTIRRDLDELEQYGMVYRSYGKVTIASSLNSEQPFDLRNAENIEAKHKISQCALKYLKHVRSIYIDGSTTGTFFADSLPADSTFTVFTNSLRMVSVLQKKPYITIFMIGGIYRREMDTCDSSTSLSQLKDIYIDMSVISCAGFNERGTVNNSIAILGEHRSMIKNSGQTLLLADASKCGRRALVPAETWKNIHTFITDQPFDERLMDTIRKQGVTIAWN